MKKIGTNMSKVHRLFFMSLIAVGMLTYIFIRSWNEHGEERWWLVNFMFFAPGILSGGFSLFLEKTITRVVVFILVFICSFLLIYYVPNIADNLH
jgi:RsiW-degrading membrane proteinase PrsW (M82 family)